MRLPAEDTEQVVAAHGRERVGGADHLEDRVGKRGARHRIKRPDEDFETARVQLATGVEHQAVRRPSDLDGGVASRAQATDNVAEHEPSGNARVQSHPVKRRIDRVVTRSVVRDQDLEIAKPVPRKRIERPADPFCLVINRGDHGDFGGAVDTPTGRLVHDLAARRRPGLGPHAPLEPADLPAELDDIVFSVAQLSHDRLQLAAARGGGRLDAIREGPRAASSPAERNARRRGTTHKLDDRRPEHGRGHRERQPRTNSFVRLGAHSLQALLVAQCGFEHERQRVGAADEQMLTGDERRDPAGVFGNDHGSRMDGVEDAHPFEVGLVSLVQVEQDPAAPEQIPFAPGQERARALNIRRRTVGNLKEAVVVREDTRAAAEVLRAPARV